MWNFIQVDGGRRRDETWPGRAGLYSEFGLISAQCATDAQSAPSSPRKKDRGTSSNMLKGQRSRQPRERADGDGVLGGVSVARANWELKIAEEGGERADRLRLAGLMLTSCFPVMTHLSANSSQSTATSQHIFFPSFFFFFSGERERIHSLPSQQNRFRKMDPKIWMRI